MKVEGGIRWMKRMEERMEMDEEDGDDEEDGMMGY